MDTLGVKALTSGGVNCGFLGVDETDELTDGWENVQPLS